MYRTRRWAVAFPPAITKTEEIRLSDLSKDKKPYSSSSAEAHSSWRALRFLELAAELREIDTVLRGFVSADEDHRNVPAIFLGEFGIQINVHLAQWGAEFAEQWSDGGFGVVAEVAAGPRVEGNFESAHCVESRRFRGDAHGFGCENCWKGPVRVLAIFSSKEIGT